MLSRPGCRGFARLSGKPWSMRYRGDPSTATGCGCRYAPSRVGEIEERWCGRWESNPHEEKSPEDFHAVYGFRRPDGAFWSAHVRFAVWTIPSPSPEDPGLRCCPSSLYTFPEKVSLRAWLGIAIAGFPEFEQFCIDGFPASTQVSLKSSASAIPPRPRGWSFAVSHHRAD